jgi:hypothetical protein
LFVCAQLQRGPDISRFALTHPYAFLSGSGQTDAREGAMKTITKHYIDGAFVESHGQEVMDIVRPTDGQVIARVMLADEEDTRRAIAAANRAFATYGRSTVEERAEILRRLHQAASARLDDLTAAMVEEYGGVVQFAGPIVQSGVNAFLAAEKALQEMPRTRRWDKTTSDTGAGRGGRLDYRMECERAVRLPQIGFRRRRRLYRRDQAKRVERAASKRFGGGAARGRPPERPLECRHWPGASRRR